MTELADLARFATWSIFLLLLVEPQRRGTERQIRSGWLLLLVAAITVWGVLARIVLWFPPEGGGNAGRFLLMDSLAAAVLSLVLLEQLYRNVPESSRWSIKPMCIGLGGAFMFDIYLFADALLFGRIDADVWSVRGFVYALAAPLVGMSVARNRTERFRVALSRHVVFHSTTLLAAGVYLLFVAAAGYYVRHFGGEWGRAMQAALLFAGLLLLGLVVFSASSRAKVRVLVSKHFFSYRYDYREEWLRFTKALSTEDDQIELGQHVVNALADLVESPGGGLWLRDANGLTYRQTARWNMAPLAATESVDGPLASFLATSGWVINTEEYRSSPLRYGGIALPAWLAEAANAWLIIPLATSGGLVGFVVLCTARTPIDVNWEVNDLLKTAGRQAASYLGQMQATEALLEARKFEAFNRMSAFVVHDLKNIVAQLSLMIKNAERHRDNPEFQQDMLMTVEHSVERMKQLMMQLREGTTPVDAPRRVELAEVVGRIARAKASQEPAPSLAVEEAVAALGHEDRLERVIGHLVQNAIDATDKEGRVWIRVARESGEALIEVGDTGHGMAPEFIRDRLFKPFQTTKQTGMGIGAYESFQYVQELGGRVLVDSTPEVGTSVRLLLPMFKGTSGHDPQKTREAA